MEAWWSHNQKKIPVFDHQYDSDRLEDLTGCIPLLLGSLLDYGGHGFSEVERNFWHGPDLVRIRRDILQFVEQKGSAHSAHDQ